MSLESDRLSPEWFSADETDGTDSKYSLTFLKALKIADN